MPVTIVYKSRPAANNMHRILVTDEAGRETVHGFGSLELAMKFAENYPGKTKYLGPSDVKGNVTNR